MRIFGAIQRGNDRAARKRCSFHAIGSLSPDNSLLHHHFLFVVNSLAIIFFYRVGISPVFEKVSSHYSTTVDNHYSVYGSSNRRLAFSPELLVID